MNVRKEILDDEVTMRQNHDIDEFVKETSPIKDDN